LALRDLARYQARSGAALAVIAWTWPWTRPLTPSPAPGGSEGGRPAVELGQPLGEGTSSSLPLYVATPDLLRHFGLGPGAVDPDTDVLTTQTGEA
jgi:hypothetical protein